MVDLGPSLEVVHLTFVHIPLARIQSHGSLWELGNEMKLCVQEENKPIWWTHGTFLATVCHVPY